MGACAHSCPLHEPARVIPAIVRAAALFVAVTGAEIGAAGDTPGAPGPASVAGRGCRQRHPLFRAGARLRVAAAVSPRYSLIFPVGANAGDARRPLPVLVFRPLVVIGVVVVAGSGIPANQAVNLAAAIDGNRELFGVRADGEPLDPPPAPLLLGELKNSGGGLADNPRFPIGQPALLGGDKAAELAAFAEIDGVVPLVAVFAGFPVSALPKVSDWSTPQ